MNSSLTMRTTLIASLTLALGACGGSNQSEETTSARLGSSTGDLNAQRMVQVGQSNDGRDGVCSLESVYFGYDDHQLDARARDAVERAMTCWRRDGLPAALHLTGATDPRGTEEYNLALGERRAQAVRSHLARLGVDQARVNVSSVGEEEARGQDESTWALDRHVRGQAR